LVQWNHELACKLKFSTPAETKLDCGSLCHMVTVEYVEDPDSLLTHNV
jgi:hypothetical protein